MPLTPSSRGCCLLASDTPLPFLLVLASRIGRYLIPNAHQHALGTLRGGDDWIQKCGRNLSYKLAHRASHVLRLHANCYIARRIVEALSEDIETDRDSFAEVARLIQAGAARRAARAREKAVDIRHAILSRRVVLVMVVVLVVAMTSAPT